MAKALDNSKVGGGDKEAQAAKLKAMKAKAEADAKAAHDKELETITTLAPPLPADLPAACAAAAAGLDAFMSKRVAGDELARWNATKEPDLRKATEECVAAGSIEVGACFGQGLGTASLAEFANGGQGEIRETCRKRYAATMKPAPE